MTRIEFTKMHGAGNDFIVIDSRKKKLANPDKVAKKICTRHFSIGADGIILVLSSKKADLRMRMFNPDGSEAEMCGNGIRCFAKYVFDNGILKKRTMSVETGAGILKPEVFDGSVKVDMGEPEISRSNIPMLGNSEPAIDEELNLKKRKVHITAVSMGNPHTITFVKDLKSYPVDIVGKEIENHSIFPNRTNVEFVEVKNKNELKVKVWERGAGETLACGTGACASVVAASLNGKIDRHAKVKLPGGTLTIEWSEKDNHIYMTGPAEEVFTGVVEI